jgi:excisionase family DNA binding protein
MPTAEDLARAERILKGTVSVSEVLAFINSDCFLSKQSATQCIDHKDERKIEEAVRLGRLRAYRVGKKTLIRKSDLFAWVMSGEITCEKSQANKTELQQLTDRAVDQARKNTAARAK